MKPVSYAKQELLFNIEKLIFEEGFVAGKWLWVGAEYI
jgi:hypothetical protein